MDSNIVDKTQSILYITFHPLSLIQFNERFTVLTSLSNIDHKFIAYTNNISPAQALRLNAV